jgi:hypothetical protein
LVAATLKMLCQSGVQRQDGTILEEQAMSTAAVEGLFAKERMLQGAQLGQWCKEPIQFHLEARLSSKNQALRSASLTERQYFP